jgi:phthiocerol/phenolphthiocerol synthesis type-I polyketide synthase A
VSRYDLAQAVMAPLSAEEPDAVRAAAPERDWSTMTGEEMHHELQAGLRSILARELGLSEAELELEVPFAELGLNSVMAMSIRRDVEQFAGIELSATMLWNHPTVAALARHLATKLAPHQEPDDENLDDSGNSVLDALFDNVESVP